MVRLLASPDLESHNGVCMTGIYNTRQPVILSPFTNDGLTGKGDQEFKPTLPYIVTLAKSHVKGQFGLVVTSNLHHSMECHLKIKLKCLWTTLEYTFLSELAFYSLFMCRVIDVNKFGLAFVPS
jgi:hypothetical protein